MKIVFAFLVIIVAVNAAIIRQKRQTFLLPDGVEGLLSAGVNSEFRCSEPGYFADIDNNCEIFHICDISINADGLEEVRQYSFACGNQTIFNQLTLTCSTPNEAVPCNAAPHFYRMNSKIGVENIPFHTEDDVNEANGYKLAGQ